MYLYAKANNLIGGNCNGSKVNEAQCFVGYSYDNGDRIYFSSTWYSRPVRNPVEFDDIGVLGQRFSDGKQDTFRCTFVWQFALSGDSKVLTKPKTLFF